MQQPIILFGAFDRHNFGDLLFPHIVAAMMPGQALVFAGLAERDLRPFGGHAVQALSRLPIDDVDHPCTLVHVGGEILDCGAWEAAVMLLPPDQAQRTIAYLRTRPGERRAWVKSMLGTSALAPYAVSRRTHPGLARVVYNAVGGSSLDRSEARLRAEVLADLKAADSVSVRDGRTRAHLAAAGIEARLVPDSAVMVAELFDARIRLHAREGAVARAMQAFPRGYIAVQFSADFGDDDSLAQIATQLHHLAGREDCGIVLFRAGVAPWHDELEALRRVATSLRHGSAQVFESLDVWDICALIAHGRAYCGSSLHGSIVANAFGRPGLCLRDPDAIHPVSKQAAYAETWDESGLPAEVELRDIAEALRSALAVEEESLQRQSRRLATLYREGFRAARAGPA